jgi:hypothetical protein
VAYVTTGTSGTAPAVVIVSDDEEVLAFLTPDESRVIARKLIEAAHRLEQPATVPDWP